MADPKPRRKTFREMEQERIAAEAMEAVRLIKLQDQAALCEEKLKVFLRVAWPILSPGTTFQDNWHINVLVEHLEALARREIRKLIINLPPRSLKSKLVSVAFPAWRWLKAPEEKFLVASYGRQLAMRDSRYCRNLIMSQWYQTRWGSRFAIASDQNEKGRFENDKGGFRIIASVEGGVLGEGGSVRIYDDPNDLDRMIKEPETYPQSVRDWYSGTAASRSIDPKTDVAVLVQQRSSFGGDLTEYLQELGGWDTVVIPNEYTGKKTIGPLALPDPRVRLGSLLFPDRLGREETETLKREQKFHYPGQYQQEPSMTGKSGLKREWFQFWNPVGSGIVDVEGKPRPVRVSLSDGSFVERIPVQLPHVFEQVVQSWDMAFKDQVQNDFVAGHTWGRVGADSFLIHRDHGHKDFPATLQAVRAMNVLFPCPEKLVEDKANGPAVIQTLKNEIPGLIAVNPEGGKWSRVAAISGYVEAGNVYLPNPDLFPWVWDLLSEFGAGISAKQDDDTDAMSQALKRLYDTQAQSGVPEFRVAARVGEPATACHVESITVRPEWRQYVAMVPGRGALWLAETPTGSLRVLRELDVSSLDAGTTGRAIAAASVEDLRAHPIPKGGSYEIFLPKSAFAPVEPVGSWAEMMEAALLAWEPTDGTWEDRESARAVIRNSRFRCDLVEEDIESAVDRLRDLLRFAPPDFAPMDYDRKRAFKLAEDNLSEYHRYMGMVEGRVTGEWPKIKFSTACPQLIGQMGSLRRDKLDGAPPFVEVLLLGVSVPRQFKPKEITTRPFIVPGANNMRNQKLMARKFALR